MNNLVRTLLGIAPIALLSFLTACTKTTHYEEEVQLSTGITVVLNRSAKRERFGEPGSGGGHLIEQRLDFKIADNNYVWKENLPPVAIDIEKGVLFVAAIVPSMKACLERGQPSPPFLFYRYENNDWKKIPKEEFPSSIRVNLVYFGDGTIGDSRDRLTLTRKREIAERLKSDRKVQSLYLLKESPARCGD